MGPAENLTGRVGQNRKFYLRVREERGIDDTGNGRDG